jgi:hypothetical protein
MDAMGTLKLYGMRAAYDETLTTAVKRQHEPQQIIGDLLTAYDRIRGDQFELAWRRADGVAECLDASSGSLTCDDTDASCTDLCLAYQEALVLATTVEAEMGELDEILSGHAAWFNFWNAGETCESNGDVMKMCVEDLHGLADYVDDLREHAQTIQTNLQFWIGALQAGIDWLGFKSGRQVVVGDPDTGILHHRLDIITIGARLNVHCAPFGRIFDGVAHQIGKYPIQVFLVSQDQWERRIKFGSD